MDATANNTDVTDLVAEIASAYVSNNQVAVSEIASVVNAIHSALTNIGHTPAPTVVIAEPAVSVKKSITQDFLICLEDGRRFKSLKRHLRSKYDMTPEAYRAKWNLPKDYPMVAPAYAKARSDLAKSMGLGQGGRVAAGTKGRKKAEAAAA